MLCMKCGKKTGENQVFCDDCLATMAAYPVKPDAIVQLPSRPETPVKKATPRKKTLSPEAQLLRSRKTIKRLSTVLACTLLALCLTVSFLVHIVQERNDEDSIGKNYSTMNTD